MTFQCLWLDSFACSASSIRSMTVFELKPWCQWASHPGLLIRWNESPVGAGHHWLSVPGNELRVSSGCGGDELTNSAVTVWSLSVSNSVLWTPLHFRSDAVGRGLVIHRVRHSTHRSQGRWTSPLRCSACSALLSRPSTTRSTCTGLYWPCMASSSCWRNTSRKGRWPVLVMPQPEWRQEWPLRAAIGASSFPASERSDPVMAFPMVLPLLDPPEGASSDACDRAVVVMRSSKLWQDSAWCLASRSWTAALQSVNFYR